MLLVIGDPVSKPFKPSGYYGLVVRGGTVLTLHAYAEDYPTTAAFTAIFLKAVAHLDAVVN